MKEVRSGRAVDGREHSRNGYVMYVGIWMDGQIDRINGVESMNRRQCVPWWTRSSSSKCEREEKKDG